MVIGLSVYQNSASKAAQLYEGLSAAVRILTPWTIFDHLCNLLLERQIYGLRVLGIIARAKDISLKTREV